MPSPSSRRVALVTLGCARNDVDSEELAGRLTAEGWELAADGAAGRPADVVLVNTCGFVAAAKKDSLDTLVEAADSGAKVVAVGCLAERYGAELAASLPEADAVLGFDAYASIGDRLDDVLAGRPVPAHRPTDRRRLLPITPTDRPAAAAGVAVPGHGAAPLPDPAGHAWLPRVTRRRLGSSPTAPVKLASGCDRRCAFCAIPSFRGAFLSRPPEEVLAEARWLAGQGVRELLLVSENSTSYGKDLGDLRLLEQLLPELARVPGILRVRVSYLQPAEVRPSLVEALATTPGVAPYFDLSFQHASEPVLRRMRRFGSTERFLALLEQVRAASPDAGVRSNVIVGFPGETRADVAELGRFLAAGRLDAVGVFGYSDEDGTEAAGYGGKLRADVVARRVEHTTRLAEEFAAQRAEERVGHLVEVLIEEVEPDGTARGRAGHQGPGDGATVLSDAGPRVGAPVPSRRPDPPPGVSALRVGDLVRARIAGTLGIDLLARPDAVLVQAGDTGGRVVGSGEPVGAGRVAR